MAKWILKQASLSDWACSLIIARVSSGDKSGLVRVLLRRTLQTMDRQTTNLSLRIPMARQTILTITIQSFLKKKTVVSLQRMTLLLTQIELLTELHQRPSQKRILSIKCQQQKYNYQSQQAHKKLKRNLDFSQHP